MSLLRLLVVVLLIFLTMGGSVFSVIREEFGETGAELVNMSGIFRSM